MSEVLKRAIKTARAELAAAIKLAKHGKQGHCRVCNADYNSLRKFLLGKKDGYQIDHIVPLYQANTDQEVFKLNDLRNLQWLLERANRRKHVKATVRGEALCQILLGRPWQHLELEKRLDGACLADNLCPYIVYCWTKSRSWEMECPDVWAAKRYGQDMFKRYKARYRIAPKYSAVLVSV